jgi:hypothetical protein
LKIDIGNWSLGFRGIWIALNGLQSDESHPADRKRVKILAFFGHLCTNPDIILIDASGRQPHSDREKPLNPSRSSIPIDADRFLQIGPLGHPMRH